MKLYLLRHGRVKKIKESGEKVLTKIGKKQITLSAKKISNLKFDLIYSSTLVRAKQTS